MSTRYDGKPLLRVLELYVLWAIGKVRPEDAATLEAMTPKLQEVYECQGAWHEVVAGEMRFPANMVEVIREMWEKNQALAKEAGEVLQPDHFAQMFVDANLA